MQSVARAMRRVRILVQKVDTAAAALEEVSPELPDTVRN